LQPFLRCPAEVTTRMEPNVATIREDRP
jgi:hypothetical protein